MRRTAFLCALCGQDAWRPCRILMIFALKSPQVQRASCRIPYRCNHRRGAPCVRACCDDNGRTGHAQTSEISNTPILTICLPVFYAGNSVYTIVCLSKKTPPAGGVQAARCAPKHSRRLLRPGEIARNENTLLQQQVQMPVHSIMHMLHRRQHICGWLRQKIPGVV